MGSNDRFRPSNLAGGLPVQVALANSKHLSMHCPQSGELKNEETNPRFQVTFMADLPLASDDKSEVYQVALSANATADSFFASDGLPRTLVNKTSAREKGQ